MHAPCIDKADQDRIAELEATIHQMEVAGKSDDEILHLALEWDELMTAVSANDFYDHNAPMAMAKQATAAGDIEAGGGQGLQIAVGERAEHVAAVRDGECSGKDNAIDDGGRAGQLERLRLHLANLDANAVTSSALEMVGEQLDKLEADGASAQELEPLVDRLGELQIAVGERAEHVAAVCEDSVAAEFTEGTDKSHRGKHHRHHSKQQNHKRRHHSRANGVDEVQGTETPADQLRLLAVQFESVSVGAVVDSETLVELKEQIQFLLASLDETTTSGTLDIIAEHVSSLQSLGQSWDEMYEKPGTTVEEDRWGVDELRDQLMELQQGRDHVERVRATKNRGDKDNTDTYQASWRTISAHGQTLRQRIHAVENRIEHMMSSPKPSKFELLTNASARATKSLAGPSDIDALEKKLRQLQQDKNAADNNANAAAAAFEKAEAADVVARAQMSQQVHPQRGIRNSVPWLAPLSPESADRTPEELAEAAALRRVRNQRKREKERGRRATRAGRLAPQTILSNNTSPMAHARVATQASRRCDACLAHWLPSWVPRSVKGLRRLSPWALPQRPSVSCATERVVRDVLRPIHHRLEGALDVEGGAVLPDNAHHDPQVKRIHAAQNKQYRFRWHRYWKQQEAEHPSWIFGIILSFCLTASVFPSGLFLDRSLKMNDVSAHGTIPPSSNVLQGGFESAPLPTPTEDGAYLPLGPQQNCSIGYYFLVDVSTDSIPLLGHCMPCESGTFDHDRDPQTPCVFCRKGYTSPRGSIICLGVPPSLPGYSQNPVSNDDVDAAHATVRDLAPLLALSTDKTKSDLASAHEAKGDGAVTTHSRAISATTAVRCNSGEQRVEQSGNCEQCPIGHIDHDMDGATACIPCPVGKAVSQAGQTECVPCPAGTTSSFKGTAVCTHCQIGELATAGATSCVACPLDTFDHDRDPKTPCIVCREGYTAPLGSIICVGVLQ